MTDQTIAESTGAAAAAAKFLSLPAVMGIIAGVLGFMFMWPKTRREGFARLIASGLCSHFFGGAMLATALHFLPWIPVEDMRAGCYLIVGLPGWWVLGWVFKFLNDRQGRDAAEVVKDIKELI